MSARNKQAFDFHSSTNDEPPANKRQRIHENTAASLDSLNDDCLLLILSYLPFEDLNSLAICSRRYQRARAHDSLDQTRSGTIILQVGITCRSLMEIRWNRIFQGNRTHLKVERAERLQDENRSHYGGARLFGVTSLHLASIPRTGNTPVRLTFAHLFPNLKRLDLSSIAATNGFSLCREFLAHCANLTEVTWNRCEAINNIELNGTDFNRISRCLCLHLDDFCFISDNEEMLTFSIVAINGDDVPAYAFHYCPTLERLSIMNATFQDKLSMEIHPVSQEVLIKMVRRHPSLRWLRSDLSAESIVMLQRERPHVTFVTE